MIRTLPASVVVLAFAWPAAHVLADDMLKLEPLAIDPSAGLQPETPPPSPAGSPTKESAPESSGKTYGHAGSKAWTFGALYANDFHQATDLNLHVAYSTFLADSIEFAVEVAAWYFDQPGPDTGGISGSMIFRWHFAHPKETYKWTFFLDAGIGVLGAFGDVPEGGTSFDFLPRLGAGFTTALRDDPNSPRLMIGLRWHHISNARIEGDERNPSRDALAVYVAIEFPY